MKNIILITRENDKEVTGVTIYICNNDSEEVLAFCSYINNLSLKDDGKLVAREILTNREYSLGKYAPLAFDSILSIAIYEKPLLIRFNQILEYHRLHNEPIIIRIIRETLKKFKSETLLAALKGLDKRSREIIMQSLPTKITDEINERIEYFCKHDSDSFSLTETRNAQQKILDAINRNIRKYEKEDFSTFAVVKD